MNSRLLLESRKLISSIQTICCSNSRSIYYAAYPYPNDTIKKMMKFLKDNKEELDYAPPLLPTAAEQNLLGDKDILNLSADQQKKLKVIKWEYELVREKMPKDAPVKVYSSEWLALLEKESTNQRKRYLKHLSEKERKNLKEEKLKLDKASKTANIVPPEFHSRLFLWILKNTINTGYSERICESLMNGPHCVVDMGYEHLMTDRDRKNTIKQLAEASSQNRARAEPFHISFTDLTRDSYCHVNLAHYFPQSYIKTEASFMDIFPSDKLIYLTANSRNDMEVYDPEAIYVVGGLVDRCSSIGAVSLAKAKKLNLRTAKFPIDQYLQWEKGSKYLALDQVFNILHTMKDCGDWFEAFKHIPRRKLKDPDQKEQIYKNKKGFYI